MNTEKENKTIVADTVDLTDEFWAKQNCITESELSSEERCLHGNLSCIKKYCQICNPTKPDNHFTIQEFEDALIWVFESDPETKFHPHIEYIQPWVVSYLCKRIENHLTKQKTE